MTALSYPPKSVGDEDGVCGAGGAISDNAFLTFIQRVLQFAYGIHFFTVTVCYALVAVSTIITAAVQTKTLAYKLGGWVLPPFLLSIYVIVQALWFLSLSTGRLLLGGGP